MKTVGKNIVKVIVIFIMGLSFTSCGYIEMGFDVDSNAAYTRNMDYLCGTTWVDSWTDNRGITHYQELRFYPNFTAEEYYRTSDYRGIINESVSHILWDWTDGMNSIVLDYGANDIVYMDDIYFSGNTLNCWFDGSEATFRAKY